MTMLLNKEINFTTQKELDKAFSLLIAEKITEGYVLEAGNPMSCEYDRMMVFIDQETNKRYGLGLKRINESILSDIEDIYVQWGELKEYSIFDYIDEEKATIEEFNLIRTKDYKNPIYVNKKEAKRIKKIKEKRRELRYRNIGKPIKEFKVNRLNIAGLKRPGKSEITIVRIKNGYNILKDNKTYKKVLF